MQPASDEEFLAGRDLAIAMLRALNAHEDPDEQALDARYREGKPQRNLALEYVREIIANPALAEGFAAVLSDGITNGFPDVDVYEGLTLSEMKGPRHDAALQAFLARAAAGASGGSR